MPPARHRMVVALGVAVLSTAVACGSAPSAPTAPAGPSEVASATDAAAPVAAVPDGLVAIPVTVPAGLGAAPFDTPRQALIPPG